MRNFLFLFFVSTLAFGQPAYRSDTLKIFKTSDQIDFDGVVEKAFWDAALKVNFHQMRPNWGVADSTTEAYITFDDQYLYFAAIMDFKSKENINGRNLVRDGWLGDDFITFHIDSYADNQNALVFSIYPLSSRFDMSVSNDAVPLGSSTFNGVYDMLWEGKTNVSEEGIWQVEYRIPLSNFRFREQEGKIFSAISVFRSQFYNNETFTFPKVPQEVVDGLMKPSLKQPVEFVDLRPKKQLLVSPYVLAGLQRGDAKGDSELNAGLDVRYGLSPKLTLDLTVNTDFSQVEADDQVINLSRASIFFPERRRIFQEQAGLYELNLGGSSQLFYSRQIGINDGDLVPILGGVRLNGKIGAFDVGALNLQTSNFDSLNSENFGVIRLRKKVLNDRSFVGFMGTSRVSGDAQLFNFGLDALIEINENNYIQTALASGGEDGRLSLDRSRFYVALVPRQQEGFLFSGNYAYSGTQFNPGIGFVDRESFHNPFFALRHGKFYERETKEKFRYQRWTFLAVDQFYSANDGKLETLYANSAWSGSSFGGHGFNISHATQYQSLSDTLNFSNETYVPEGDYLFNNFSFSFSPGQQVKWRHEFSTRIGKFYDGTLINMTYSPTIRFNKHINFSARYKVNRLVFDERDQKDWVHVFKLRTELALNLHLSGSYTVQLNSDSETVLHNARVRYNFRDGHDLFLVYNSLTENIAGLGENTREVASTWIVKYNYTLFR